MSHVQCLVHLSNKILHYINIAPQLFIDVHCQRLHGLRGRKIKLTMKYAISYSNTFIIVAILAVLASNGVHSLSASDCCQEDAYYDESVKSCRHSNDFNMTIPMLLQCDEVYEVVNGTYNMTFKVNPNGRVSFQINSYQAILDTEYVL